MVLFLVEHHEREACGKLDTEGLAGTHRGGCWSCVVMVHLLAEHHASPVRIAASCRGG
jgi:hypothetical protein